MSYFEKFPKIVYTLDEYRTGQIVPDILRRTKFISDLTTNFAFFDDYDVKDGETPEIVADLFYNNPTLHWVILQTNEIIDPRFDWPLSTKNLLEYTRGKYANINAVHHYEDSTGNIINGNVSIISSNEFGNVYVGNVIVNNTNTGTGFVIAKTNNSTISVTVTAGGFQTGDSIYLADNTSITANVTSTSTLSGIPVTNIIYEDVENEKRRRISILKPEIIAEVISDFESTIKR